MKTARTSNSLRAERARFRVVDTGTLAGRRNIAEMNESLGPYLEDGALMAGGMTSGHDDPQVR